MKAKKPDFLTYGTQFYRAPTPLPDEWEPDIKQMVEWDMESLQLRVQWRWNEPVEGQYRFDDIDAFFELAAKRVSKTAASAGDSSSAPPASIIS